MRAVTCVGRCVSFLRVEPAGAPGKFHKAVVLIFPDILLRKARPILLTPRLAFLAFRAAALRSLPPAVPLLASMANACTLTDPHATRRAALRCWPRSADARPSTPQAKFLIDGVQYDLKEQFVAR